MFHLRVFMFGSDTFTDTAISSSRVNGEHKEKVLQRWEGGDSNGENYDLDNDAVSLSVCLTHSTNLTNMLQCMNIFLKSCTYDYNYSSFLFLFAQSNGWDANEMFRYNEMKYGVTSTYDSSLSMYT